MEQFVDQSENVDSSLELNAGVFMKEHHSLDEESLAGGSKGAELDETLRGYKSEDETMSRGYYTSKFDRIAQSASTSTPKRQDEETPSQNENIGDFQILKDGLASPKTLERKREFAWQQFLVREKHKEELYKQFEAGKLKAALPESGDDIDKKPEVPLDGASQKTAKDQTPCFDGIGGGGGGDNGVVTIQSFTRERQNLKSIPKVRTRDFNANKPVKNKYQDPKVLTYPSSAQTSAQDCKRPIPTVADIEAMISSVKVGMDGNQNRGASTRFPAPRREITYRVTRSNKRPNDKPAMSARLHPAPSPIKMLPMPTYPPPPPPPATYNLIPTLPIPSATPTYSPRPLPLAPPDLTRPPPGFSFPLISNPVPPSNVYVPPPPSAFPVPIMSQPPPTGDFNGGLNIYPLLSPPRSREICTPEGDRFDDEEERRIKVKKNKSGRRLLARSLSRDRSKGSGRSRSGERFRSRDKSISCERRTRSRSRERERSKQSRKRSKNEKMVKKKSTSRIENKPEPSTLSPEMDLTHTDSGNTGKAGKGTQALVKEYINDETGILEVFKGPGQQGAIVLFHINQLWILDKKLDQHGDPVRFKDVEHGGNVRVTDLVPVGQLVLANIRSVRSQFVDFQATVIWPSFLQQPPYTVNPGDLNDQLTAFHSANNLDTFLPLCIAGVETQGSTRMWDARVKEIINDNWGIIEVNFTNKERNSNPRPKLCLFNKDDVWMVDGLHVANHEFFVDKPLADLVVVGQSVNMTARSITKDNLKVDSDESGVHMQALCVSLQTDVIPARAGAGTKLLGGPGTIGGSCNDQTPYMFEMGLSKKLNKKLGKFLGETGRKYEHIDGRFLEVKVKEEVIELIENNNNTTESNKKIHKITDIEEMARLYQTKTGASLELNTSETLEHIDSKEGIVIRILDDNFGIIQHEGFNVLFDTCDLWISSQFTAAKKLQKLQSVIKVGVRVVFHAALIEKSANIPYLASAVWPAEATFFNDPAKCPAPIRKESIHVDKIKIYEMVSETVKEPLPNISSVKGKKVDEKVEGTLPQRLSGKPPQYVSQHVHAFEGIVKIGFKLKSNPELFCGIVEFVGQDLKNEATEQIYYAFFLSKSALEEHEKRQIAVPKNRVFFNASQFKDLGFVSYLITTISKIHKVLPHEVISRTTDTVGEVKKILTNILAQNLPEITKIKSSSYAILTLETSTIEELIGPSLVADVVINCNDGCRLVCMINKDSGVLEDSSRNLCYFERSDLNLETDLVLHDLVVLFTRINLIRIRFQATEVEEVARLGPVKLVAHDKSVKISGDIGDRLPNVKKCASNYGKYEEHAKRFSIDKVGRAKEAAIMFKLGNYLKPEFILDSPDFKPQYDVGKKKDMRKPIIRKSVLGEFKPQETIAVDKNKQTKRPGGRMKSRSRSRERYFSSPRRIIRTSNKDGTFETQSQSRRQETLKKESAVQKNQMRRPSSEDASLKRKKKLFSFVGKNPNHQTKESLSCCKILERYKGKVRSILNENFGLIEFYLDLKYPAFCLFDTCDLFIENDETAAQGKLTVGNVLSLDMEVSFNAVELQPAKAVPWLATAVWRTDGPVHKFPTVVEPQNIKEGKVDVYKKMAETCEVLVFNLLKPVGATDTVYREEETVVLERRATDVVELEKRRARRRRPKNEEVETNPKFLEDRWRDLEVVKQMKAYKTYSRECPRDAREPRDPLTPDRFLIQSKTNWDESVKDWKLEIHAWYREQSKEYNEKRKRYIRDPDDQVKKKRRRSRSPERSGHLPHKIYDHVTSGTLEHVVSELYAVVRLNSPPGAKAILHYDRVWVDDHQIFGGWRVLNYGWFQDLRINARRIHVDTLGIDYQVTFAHVGIRSYDPKRGVYNYTGRMAKFVEDRMDTRELDRELDKCLDIMRK